MFNNYENNYIFKILLKVYYMQLFKDSDGGLDGILRKVGNKVKDGFRNFKDKVNEPLKYLEGLEKVGDKTYYGLQKVKDRILKYGTIIKDKIGEFPKYLNKELEKIVYKTMEYVPKIAFSALPSPARVSISEGLYIINADKSLRGKLIGYGLIIAGGASAVVSYVMFGLHAIHSLPSNHVHLVGYIAFVPNGLTINYDGQTGLGGDLILPNGTEIKNVIWIGQYAGTINNTHILMNQLNSQFVGQIDPINGQQYVPLRDFYIIDTNNSQVPIQQTTIGGQTYYVIDANNINPADIAGFYTYQGWVTNFVEAINTPGTYAARIPGNSPVYDWANITGTLAYETHLYQHYIIGFSGGSTLVLPNGTIIPYGYNDNVPGGTPLSNFINPQQLYTP